jgi:hypothetical protein
MSNFFFLHQRGRSWLRANLTILAVASAPMMGNASARDTSTTSVAVGSQYDSTHVYVASGEFDAFVTSFVATFGGKPSPRIVTNVLPVPSNTAFQYVWTPVGTLSTFAFQTPVPYPFGQERTGYLVTDINQAIRAAREAGAEVVVDKFKDRSATTP